jgi:RNA polymerase sigma factor (TIGR02999 family)
MKNDITQILDAVASGDPLAIRQLFERVYAELQGTAVGLMGNEKPGQTLDASGLIHEVYLRLFGSGDPLHFENRHHFFGTAARAMRQILVENARRKRAKRHGGGMTRQDLDNFQVSANEVLNDTKLDLLALNEILDRFAAAHPKKAELVDLRFFAGKTHEEIVLITGNSLSAVKRDWRFARAWLLRELTKDEQPESNGAGDEGKKTRKS